MIVDFGTFDSLLIPNSKCKRRKTGFDDKGSFVPTNEIEEALPTLQSTDYFTDPCLSELATRESTSPGYLSRVPDFTVGRFGYGNVKFVGETDVRFLDLDRIVKLRRHEVVVYEDENEKPEVGEGLNKPAEVTLQLQLGSLADFSVECLRQIENKLRARTESQGAQFISFNPLNGQWKFLVPHFSRFGLSEDDEEDITMDDVPPEVQDDGHMDGGEISDIDEETALVDPSVLSHSLPAHLGLDPVKMKEMKMLMFPDGDEEAKDFYYPTSHQRQPYNKESSRSPIKFSSKVSAHKPTPQLGRKTPLALVEYDATSFGSTTQGSILLAQQNKSAVLKTTSREGFSLDLMHKTPVTGSHSCNIVDAGLFMGRSFRVGWGPNGVLVHSGKLVGSIGTDSALSSVIKIEKVAVDKVARDENHKTREELVHYCFDSPLTLHKELSHETKEVGVGPFKLKLRKVVCDGFMLSEICRNYVGITENQLDVPGLSSASRTLLVHQVLVWELIKVLFSSRQTNAQLKPVEADREGEMMFDRMESTSDVDKEALPLIRRAEFSFWLQESVCHRVQEEVSSLNESSDLEHVFLLLTGRQLDAAVELAASRGDVRLACLLSHAGGSTVSRSDIARQLDIWKINGMDFSFIEKDRIRLLELLSGNILGALHDIKVDWKRFLGLLMWFHLPPDTSLPTIFRSYQQLLLDEKAPYPVPVYIDEGSSEDSLSWHVGDRFDIAYYLMVLHANEGKKFRDLKTMFSAFASTDDPLDYHMVWHQRAILEAVGTFSSNDLHLIDMGLVSQLLCLGKCHWAIYVVLHIPYREDYPFLHANLIREILFQYCEIWSSQDSQQKFIEELGIPSAWLHEALAVYFNYCGDLPKALEHFLQCAHWQKAHTIFITSNVYSLFLSGKHSEIWRLVTNMENHQSEIDNWDLGAGIYVSFYMLRNSLQEESNTMSVLDTLEDRMDACSHFISRLNESLAVWGGKLPVDARVVYSKMAEEICNLLLSVSGEDATSEDDLLSCFDRTVFTAPIPEDLRACHLQDAVSLFTCYLGETAS